MDGNSNPNKKLEDADTDLRRRLAQAIQNSKDPLAFGIAAELVLESLVMRVNN